MAVSPAIEKGRLELCIDPDVYKSVVGFYGLILLICFVSLSDGGQFIQFSFYSLESAEFYWFLDRETSAEEDQEMF